MAVLAVKFKNELLRHADPNMALTFSLKNILVNGEKRGCSGFVRNEVNGSVVYLTTEQSTISDLGYLYRYADDEKDYRGYHNRWADDVLELAEEVCCLLQKTPAEDGDCRV